MNNGRTARAHRCRSPDREVSLCGRVGGTTQPQQSGPLFGVTMPRPLHLHEEFRVYPLFLFSASPLSSERLELQTLQTIHPRAGAGRGARAEGRSRPRTCHWARLSLGLRRRKDLAPEQRSWCLRKAFEKSLQYDVPFYSCEQRCLHARPPGRGCCCFFFPAVSGNFIRKDLQG